MITFQVSHGDDTVTFEMEPEKTIEDVKKVVMDKFKIENKNVDLELCLDKPIRSLGKFNVEPGMIPRTMDRYQLHRYEMDGRTISCNVHLVDKHIVSGPIRKKRQSFLHSCLKTSTFDCNAEQQSCDPKTFDINNEDDFPSLS